MHTEYQHPSIQLYIMGVKSSVVNGESAVQESSQPTEVGTNETKHEDIISESSNVVDKRVNSVGENEEQDSVLVTRLPNGKLSDWEVRRYGSMAARLLRDVKIT